MAEVSVIIPAWNASGFIAEAIRSVRRQGLANVEIVVVNDGSSDTPELERVLDGEGRDGVRYLVQPNSGPSAARNAGIRAAAAEVVALLDADDWWEPGFLQAQLRHLRAEGLDLVYCDAYLEGDSPLAGRTYMATTPSDGPVTLDSLVDLRCNVPTTCVVARRAAILEAGGFDETLRRCEDYDLWMRMAARGSRFGYHRAVLAHRRLHKESAASDRARMMESQIVVYRKLEATLGPDHPITPAVRRQASRAEADRALELSKRRLAAGAYDEARALLDEARRFYRSRKLALASVGLRTVPRLLRRMYPPRT